MKQKKKIRTYEVTSLTIRAEDLGGRIDETINLLKNHKEDLVTKGYSEIELQAEYYGHDGGIGEWSIWGTRLETDNEFEIRIKNEERAQERQKVLKSKQEQKDLKEYKRLKKKFDKKGEK